MATSQTNERAHGPGGLISSACRCSALLAINLAAGVALAALVVGGLLALNPGGLRHLIFADASPGTALGLLLFGFVVTFGSAAMGTAIMAMGRAADDEKRRGPPAPVAQPAHAMAPARRPR